MTDEPTAVAEAGEETAALTALRVEFHEQDDDTVRAVFPAMNGTKPFEIVIQNMNWGLLEDLDAIQDIEAPAGAETGRMRDNPQLMAILSFFREYVEGGPKAVPFKHTQTVFNTIAQYMAQTMGTGSKN